MSSRTTTMTWADIDDLITTTRQAADLIEALHMMAESHQITKEATGALQQVAQDAERRLSGVVATLETHLGECK